MKAPGHLELISRAGAVAQREQNARKVGDVDRAVGPNDARALEVVARDRGVGREVVGCRRVVVAEDIGLARATELTAASMLRVLLIHLPGGLVARRHWCRGAGLSWRG